MNAASGMLKFREPRTLQGPQRLINYGQWPNHDDDAEHHDSDELELVRAEVLSRQADIELRVAEVIRLLQAERAQLGPALESWEFSPMIWLWLRPGIIALIGVVLIVVGGVGAAIYPGPYPSVLVPIGLVILFAVDVWRRKAGREPRDGG